MTLTAQITVIVVGKGDLLLLACMGAFIVGNRHVQA